jgi:hypothetical protein
MAGFVKQHFSEVDGNSDGTISLEELKAVAIKMWEKYLQGEGFAFPRPPQPEKP